MRSLIAFVGFLFCTLTGYTLAIQSWGGGVFVYLGEERAPAAVRNPGDYSEVPRSALHLSADRQLLKEAEVEQRDGYVGLHFGNPLVRKAHGSNAFACRVRGRDGLYNRILMTFTGTGVSQSGDSAQMLVETPCEAGQDAAILSTIWVPMKDIVNGGPQDRTVEFENVVVKLRQMPGVWPDSWVLSEVRVFRSDDPTGGMNIDPRSMLDARESLLSFEYNLGSISK